jgi:hypothetical protein
MTPEERKAYNKARYEANKARILEQQKAYRQENKIHRAEQGRVYREAHKAEIAERTKAWLQTPAGKKSRTLKSWRYDGLIDSDSDNYEKRYTAYLQATHCAACKCEFKDSYDRCMDHDHDTGLFRQFLCRQCNSGDRWRKFSISSANLERD